MQTESPLHSQFGLRFLTTVLFLRAFLHAGRSWNCGAKQPALPHQVEEPTIPRGVNLQRQ
jgi:hypothetical protein